MPGFDPGKLSVNFDDQLKSDNLILPRKYTLTHSDLTGELFLYIGRDFDHRSFSSLYSRLIRDEVLGEWKNLEQSILDIRCLVSGGLAIGPSKWRESIFRQHMDMVLEAICYGDRVFLQRERDLLNAPIYVHFITRNKKLQSMQEWGIISDFMPGN